MKETNGHHKPRIRQDGLIVRELPDEVLVYDKERDKAHCLNQTAGMIFKYCDGMTPVGEIAKRVGVQLNSPVDEKVVWYALDQFERDNLLEEKIHLPAVMAGMNRRQMVRTLGLAALVAVPVVTSIIAPTPAQAVTCLPTGGGCSVGSQCCSGVCSAGACT
jgi:hypothetical protein